MQNKENTDYLLERLYVSTEIPFHAFDKEGNLILRTGFHNIKNDPFYIDKNLWREIEKKSSGKQIPTLYIEEGIYIYGSFFDEQGNIYICGPAALTIPSVSKMRYYRERHGTGREDYTFLITCYMELANLLAMAFWGVTEKQVTEDVILTTISDNISKNQIVSEDIDKYQFEKSEQGAQHLTYQYEQKYLTAVENGDIDFFEKSFAVDPKAMEKVGKLAHDNSKQMEYMCLSSIVLVTRSAIQGGLNPSSAYALSELYMQKLERCNNTQEILKLHQTMREDFVTRVKQQKERKAKKDYVEKCKDYIGRHVHSKIQIKDIAEAIGLNHSYLSRKFREQEGITIAGYNNKVRLRAAANMLKYSEASIAEVADYFYFASQSRFGKQFKKEFGVTPCVYRKENQIIDFIS